MKSLFTVLFQEPGVGEIWTESRIIGGSDWYIKRVEDDTVWFTIFKNSIHRDSWLSRTMESFLDTYKFKAENEESL